LGFVFSRFGWACGVAGALVLPARAQVEVAPRPDQLLSAFRYVTSRMEREAKGDDAEPGDAALGELGDPAPDAPGAGACVTLRLNSAELARGLAMENADSVRVATEQAIAGGRAGLPEARDMLQRAARAQQWEQVTASVELAGPLVALDIATFADAGGRVMVGVEGVAVRMGARTEAVFPAQMLIANDTAPAALIALVSRITGDPTLAMPGVPGHEAGDLAKLHGVTIHKFRVAHAAQMQPGGVAVPLTRGGRVVLSRDVTLASMRRFADDLAGNILAQRTRVEGREEFFGAYWPLQGRSEGVAGVREKALACLALCEAARIERAPAGDGADLPRQVAAAQEMLVPLLSIQGRLADSDVTPTNAAMLLVAMSELFAWTGAPKGDWYEPLRVRLARVVEACVDEGGAWTDATRVPERSIIALALVKLATDPVLLDGDAPDAFDARARGEGAVRALFRETPPQALVMHMPWLARTELVLAGGGEVKSDAALRQMRETAWTMQVGAVEASLVGNDLEGGLMLAGPGGGGDATPTAQSARAFAFFAQALCDPRLTDEAERPAQTSRLLKSLRFMRQLAVDDSWDWCLPDPTRAKWGVRVSATDQRQSLDATSMTLITVSEVVRGLGGPVPSAPKP
jgi:hypothetical protein